MQKGRLWKLLQSYKCTSTGIVPGFPVSCMCKMHGGLLIMQKYKQHMRLVGMSCLPRGNSSKFSILFNITSLFSHKGENDK